MVDKAISPFPGRFHDELEALKASRKPCEIVFRSENGARTVIRDRIAGLFTREDREWLRTGSGIEIGLDKLEQVDGLIPSKYC
jgi:hypothetical protein